MHILDYQKLEELFAANPSRLTLVLTTVQERIPQWQEEIATAMDSGNPQTIRTISHAIRGTAGTIRAERLEAAAAAWAEMAKSGNTAETTTAYQGLSTALQELADFINHSETT